MFFLHLIKRTFSVLLCSSMNFTEVDRILYRQCDKLSKYRLHLEENLSPGSTLQKVKGPSGCKLYGETNF